jgi:hypothetical protein
MSHYAPALNVGVQNDLVTMDEEEDLITFSK